MKLYSWNVNGVRSVSGKGFLQWFEETAPDVVCLQETKAFEEQLDEKVLHPLGYHSVWHSAERPGYSGVATYCKKEPLSVTKGMGVPEIDSEGRVLVSEFRNFVLVNAYFPNSGRDHSRLPYKLRFCAAMRGFLDRHVKAGKNVVLCGDYNVAHREIDLKNPKSNTDTAGFLPEERAWMDEFTGAGYVDTFRHFCAEPGHYTWWSYRPGVRAKNIGWRIDYFCVNPDFLPRVKSTFHEPKVTGSDHCPVGTEIKD